MKWWTNCATKSPHMVLHTTCIFKGPQCRWTQFRYVSNVKIHFNSKTQALFICDAFWPWNAAFIITHPSWKRSLSFFLWTLLFQLLSAFLLGQKLRSHWWNTMLLKSLCSTGTNSYSFFKGPWANFLYMSMEMKWIDSREKIFPSKGTSFSQLQICHCPILKFNCYLKYLSANKSRRFHL